MTPIAIEEYTDAMRAAICTVCVCFTEDRKNPTRCVHENSGTCGLFAHLSEVIDVVSGIDDDSMEGYTDALRRMVCANCDHQNERGICDLRDRRGPLPTWCILEAYYSLIVGAIEEVESQHAALTS